MSKICQLSSLAGPEADATASKSVHIRRATQTDALALYQAERDHSKTPGLSAFLPYEVSQQEVLERILRRSAAGILLVAECAGRTVGHAGLEPHALSMFAHVYTLTLMVHTDQAAGNVETRLMNALIGWATQESRIEKIEWRVRQNDFTVRRLCRRYGFAEEGRFARSVKLLDGTYLADVALAKFF